MEKEGGKKRLNLVRKESSRAQLYYSSTIHVAPTIEEEREAVVVAEKVKKDTRGCGSS